MNIKKLILKILAKRYHLIFVFIKPSQEEGFLYHLHILIIKSGSNLYIVAY